MALPFSRDLSTSRHLLPGLLLTTAFTPVSAATLCDLNGDSKVTRTDLEIMLQARGHPVATPADVQKDIDRNGVINSSDVRLCVCKLETTAACEREPNLHPIAVPGNHQTVEQVTFSAITLDGSQSADPEGDRLNYRWVFEQRPAGSQTVLSNAHSVSPNFIPDRPGNYQIALTVTDTFDLSHTERVTVIISRPPVNLIAVADSDTAQPDKAAISGNVVSNDNLDHATVSIISLTHDGQIFAPGTVFTTAAGARFQLQTDGYYTYTPPLSGKPVSIEEQFTYTIAEAGGAQSHSTLTVTLNPAPVEPPVNLAAAADSNTAQVGKAAVSGNVIDNDSLDHATVSIISLTHDGQTFAPGTIFTTAAGARFQLQTDGYYTYTPPASAINAVIKEQFTYTIAEAGGAQSHSTLTVTLNPAPVKPPVIVEPPVNLAAAADSSTAQVGKAAVSGNVIHNDSLDHATVSIISLTHDGQIFAPGTVFTTAAGARFQLQTDGYYTYTPPASAINAVIKEQFTYTIAEAGGAQSHSTLTVTLNPAPVKPPVIVEPPVNLVAVADSNATQVGKAAVSGNVISNDALDNAEVLVIDIIHNGQSFTPGTAFTTGAGSSLQLQADGNYTYLPSDQVLETAVDEVFTYTIRATNGATSQATLTIRLTPVNKLPLPVADVAATEAGGSSVSGNVTSNDNLGNTPTTVTQISLPTTPHGGAFTLQEDGSYTYTPPATLNSAVEETFTYTLKDHDGETSTATLTITVTTNNQSPEAKADSRITEAAATAIIGNVLSNDRLGNTPTNVTLLMHDDRQQPFGETFDTVHGGWFRLFEDGRYMYVMPEAGSISSVVKEAFTYTIEDADGESSTATLTVQVFPVVFEHPNHSPLARPDSIQIIAVDNDTTPHTGDNVLANDDLGDEPTVVTPVSIQLTQHGGAFQLRADGTYSYITPAVVTGVLQEIFPYTITDIDNDISSATLTIHVAPSNRSPLARADVNRATAGSAAISANVLVNDDLGDQPASVTPILISATPLGGSFELQANGNYVYTSPTELNGVIDEVFTYTLTDQDGETSTATLTIRVSPLNLAPNANNDVITIQQDNSGNVIDVLF